MTLPFKINGSEDGTITINPKRTAPHTGGTWSVDTRLQGHQPKGRPWTYHSDGTRINSKMTRAIKIHRGSYVSMNGTLKFDTNGNIIGASGHLFQSAAYSSSGGDLQDLTWEASATDPLQRPHTRKAKS